MAEPESSFSVFDQALGDLRNANWVEAECERKQVPLDSPAAGEEGFAGPLIVGAQAPRHLLQGHGLTSTPVGPAEEEWAKLRQGARTAP